MEGAATQIPIRRPVGVLGLVGVQGFGVVAGRTQAVAAMGRVAQHLRMEQVVPDSKACSHLSGVATGYILPDSIKTCSSIRVSKRSPIGYRASSSQRIRRDLG